MLEPKQLKRICRLWNELADFDMADSEAALIHLLKTVAGWVGADNGVWIGGVRMMSGKSARRDRLHGWRVRMVRHWLKPREIIRLSRLAEKTHDTDPGMTTMAVVRRAGHFRSYRLNNGSLVNVAKFKRTPHYEIYFENAGVADRIWVVFPVNQDAESYFLFDRYRGVRAGKKSGGRKSFSPKDEQLAMFILCGLKWFHRQLMLRYGLLVAGDALTAAEQKILAQLLTDKSEKEIADELKCSFHTAHRHVTEIFRKFGVNGRAGLMALWLGKAK